jgi:hypothetical protein
MLVRRFVSVALAGCLLAAAAPSSLRALLGAGAVRASGVDGAGRTVVIPLVLHGPSRESMVILTNPGPEPVLVSGIYVGAEGTPLAASKVGPRSCPRRMVDPFASLALPLHDFCPDLRTPDVENFGYLEMTSLADTQGNFLATSRVDTSRGTTFGVPGQPVGAFDPSQPIIVPPGQMRGLRVIGLSSTLWEQPVCYLASLGEPKTMLVTATDGQGSPIAPAQGIGLPARRMVRVSPLNGSKITASNLRVEIASNDRALVVAGCAVEYAPTLTIDYTPAQTPVPLDAARLRTVRSDELLLPGTYQVGFIWGDPLVGLAPQTVTLSTYLRWDDIVSCSLAAPLNPLHFDGRFWLQIQVRDPLGAVVAGGPGAKDTGVFSTRVRGAYPPGTTQRWLIEVSYDAAAHAQLPWPGNQTPGRWAVTCSSAAGMSEPIPVHF